MTPISKGSMEATFRPESLSAWSAATIAYCVKRSVRRSSLRSSRGLGSKFFISQAKRVLKCLGSKCVIGPAPLLPATNCCQKESGSFPRGVTAPMPVTTTFFMSIFGFSIYVIWPNHRRQIGYFPVNAHILQQLVQCPGEDLSGQYAGQEQGGQQG